MSFRSSFLLGLLSIQMKGGAVGIISASRKDWSIHLSAKIEEKTPELNARIKGRSDDDNTLDSCQPSQLSRLDTEISGTSGRG
ncbi:DExH-box ATP-dependent RNA helicase DExH7, chloroplastic-like isoform X2 [Rhododendron vialii]|nr:DExH-box ATP-dependent RNA helicase DExH7, chloroplastic-like isoform X2 [Rhododendron vialii]